MYFGKEGGNVEKNLVWCVVRDFIVLIEGNNYYLYMDNFYCDFYLFIEWMNFGIYCCGIVRVGRKGFFKDIFIVKVDEKCLFRGYF